MRLVPDHEAPTRIFWSDLNRTALIRIPLGWFGETNLAQVVNPRELQKFKSTESRQTVELRSPDGSALVHLLLAGIVMSADWGFLDNRSLKLAEHYYADAEMSKDREAIKTFPSLPASCVASSRILHNRRNLYERDGVFPPSIIDYVIRLLQTENDEQMAQRLAEMTENERLKEMRKIMHKDLHRH
jgi:glutamine synthetase